jgi:hypothetical protein
LFNDNYDHGIIRKYVAYVGALFSNVHIDRTLEDGSLAARFKVPLHFAKMEHALQRVLEDPTTGMRPEAIVLPAISYDLIDMQYAANRHQQSRQRSSIELQDDPNKLGVMHVPVAYDFHFRVSALVKNINDGFKIIEAIVPYFSPDYTATLELVPEMGISTAIPLVLESTALEFEVPKEYQTRVTFILVLDFVLQGYLYGPEKKWPIIKFANVGFHIDTGSEFQANATVLTVTTQPGLTANGEPTSDINETVPYLTIAISDDYGYIERVTQVPNNLTEE